MSRHLLVVAFHFPPIQASSGVHRTLGFARYLGDYGWRVTVLTAQPQVYESVREDNVRLIPEGVQVVRARAWDAARHFSIRGRYLQALALPDRWQSWILGGTLAARRLIRKDRVDAVLTTFPIASAHVIGLVLKRMTGLPWIADFRDPMAQEAYPTDEATRKAYHWIERRVFKAADRVTVTTPGTAEYYHARYGSGGTAPVRVIENGFDPSPFAQLAANATSAKSESRKLLLLHSGVLYPADRNPEPFFRALADLRKAGVVSSNNVEVRFRASGFEEQYNALTARYGLADMVHLAPAMPYVEALEEMVSADALLLFQARTCNRQIPAKLYEYLCASRPVLGLTDPEGDSGRILRDMHITGIAPLEEPEAIRTMLQAALPQIRAGTYYVPPRDAVMRYSRRDRAGELAALLQEIA